MNDVTAPLVLVAHPHDETLEFSSVCAGAEVVSGLQHFGWQNTVSMQVLPRFEPVDGHTSPLTARRPGSCVRLSQAV
jgi:hypothetical protein